ncbi:23S rRNA (guanosine(2251)-2'-O)-methyltransferase RlmB [Virgibacillus sp. MSP4-1]|uniref:23S rRNA (guanosine(2251)-2'-O)-methyltransferase RlmB n=1 Tax=Virgibacillus sp. MSP4-1 TaxID=2700081 RepID=UPI0003A42755|nr:23S rRNA (guanosine(2251)-2'-O)-methyltransferase RlmB [Virgibacillus sp. MSP4-1]QHS23924.1 23S rRNA (guanosine(2251)-2'-O)-methyltransferase RlmB [Virgibacillus sp. MSP4-1]
MKEEWIVGKNPVIEALKSGREMNKVMVLENLKPQSAKQIQQLAKTKGVTVQAVPKRKLDQIGQHHQGVAASIAAYDYATLDELYDRAEKKGESPFFIILDELEDPHNLGSILRTADATGAHGVIIPKRRSVQLTQTVVKASTGAVEYIPVARVTNLARTIDELKEKNIWVAGTDAKGTEDYRELNGDMPLALVIGSEGKGMSRLVRDKCDWLVSLPMKGKVTSLNASVAAGLLMYEVYRKRSPIGE